MKKILIISAILAFILNFFGAVMQQTNNLSNNDGNKNEETNKELLATLDRFWELSLKGDNEQLKQIITETPQKPLSFVSPTQSAYDEQNTEDKSFQISENSLYSSDSVLIKMKIDTISSEIKRKNLFLKSTMNIKIDGDMAIIWMSYGDAPNMMLHRNSFRFHRKDNVWKIYSIGV